MEEITSLPERPLTTEEISNIDGLAPFSGFEESELIYSMFFLANSQVHALGFDPAEDAWTTVHSVRIVTRDEQETQEKQDEQDEYAELERELMSWILDKYKKPKNGTLDPSKFDESEFDI